MTVTVTFKQPDAETAPTGIALPRYLPAVFENTGAMTLSDHGFIIVQDSAGIVVGIFPPHSVLSAVRTGEPNRVSAVTL
jgi:hypothetical protein